MPIKVNLLAEALAEEQLRKNDPVKRAVVFGVLLVVLSLVWFSSILLVHMMAGQQLTTIQAQIDHNTNDYSQVQVKLKKVAEIQKKLDALQKLSDARFLQGTLLNAFQKLHVTNVDLTRLHVDQLYTSSGGGTPSVTNSLGVIPGGKGSTTERVTITLDAKDYSSNPGDQVNPFQDTMASQEYFKAGMSTTNGIHMASISAPQSSADGRLYVLFTVEYHFADKSR